MSDVKTSTGSCLCGSVKVTVNALKPSVGACHCSMCRNWGGGPLLAVDCGSDVVFEGEAYVKSFDSSAWAERGFCSNCGTHLFYKLKEQNQFILPVGLLEDSEDFVFDHQIFIDEKPSYYCFSNETRNMTGQEVFDMYAPK